MDIIVAHGSKETPFSNLKEAIKFADSWIEDGGYADISIYLERGELFNGYPFTLAVVYIYVDGELQG